MQNSPAPDERPVPEPSAEQLYVPAPESELVQVALEEATSPLDIRLGRTFTVVVKIPPWPPEESGFAAKRTEWFVYAEHVRFECDARMPDAVTGVEIEGKPAIRIPFVEGPEGGTLYFRMTLMHEGTCDLTLYSLEGEDGTFDVESRKVWRLCWAEFQVVLPNEGTDVDR